MNKFVALLVLAVGSVGMFSGCGDSGLPKVETFEVPAPDPLARAKAILTNYSNGMPVTSEAGSFDDIATQVKAKDAAKGEILEKGFSAIRANPGSAKSKANELLKQL